MNSLSDLKKVLKFYDNLPLFHKLFISFRYFMVPWDKVIDKIGHSGKILDFGTGHALFLNLLRIKRPNLSLYGFEPDPNKERIVREKLGDDSVSFLSKEAIDKLDNNFFDFIVISDVLYCVDSNKWEEILNSIYRVLKPNGLLIVKETDDKPKLKKWLCIIQENIAIKILGYTKGETPRFFSYKYYLKIFDNTKFKVVENHPIHEWYPWPHYLFVLKK